MIPGTLRPQMEVRPACLLLTRRLDTPAGKRAIVMTYFSRVAVKGTERLLIWDAATQIGTEDLLVTSAKLVSHGSLGS